MTTKRPYNRQPGIACPECGGKLIGRSSVAVTPTVREIHFLCDNDACGQRFIGQLALVRRIILTSGATPKVHLPIAAGLRPANDDQREPANDDTTPAAELPAAAVAVAIEEPMTG